MKLNLGFLKKWGKDVTDTVCRINGVDPHNKEAKALLGYNLQHEGEEIQVRQKELELFHGSTSRTFVPVLEHGNFNHDFGQGFYMTDNLELAREWAVSYGQDIGYVHGYTLNLTNLKVLDFRELSILNWVAEIMSHRNQKTMSRYCKKLVSFLERYKVDTTDYDVLIGYRADASHFNIVKAFIQNQLDFTLLESTIRVCESGTQFCLKTPLAFDNLYTTGALEEINKAFSYNYNNRDVLIRMRLEKIINSKSNRLDTTFNDIMGGNYA